MASHDSNGADELLELIRRLEIRVEQQGIAVTMVGRESRSRVLLEEQLKSYQDMLAYLRARHLSIQLAGERRIA